jgi:hypothetical protein
MSDENSTSDRRRKRRDPASDASLCGFFKGANGDWHRNTKGERCSGQVLAGTTTCRSHPGVALARAKAKGAVVVELRNWGLTDEHVDPGELMLRLVAQSAARVEFYGGLLREAYEAAERLRAAEEAAGPDEEAAQTARLDFERVMNTGGVAVLIGHTYAGTQTSGVIATGEAIRGLAKLEAEERDRAFNFASKAKAAGIAAEQLELAKRLGGQLMVALRGLASALGHSADDPLVLSAIQLQVGSLLSSPVIEGQVAA